jgi:hypothetical protein
VFYPSSQWLTAFGPIEQYVLADLYAWFEAHSGLSRSSVTNIASAMEANASSLNMVRLLLHVLLVKDEIRENPEATRITNGV